MSLNRLESLEWNALSCHDRALAIAAERLRPNSAICFVLFRMLWSDRFERYSELRIGDNEYYKRLSDFINIRISLDIIPASRFQLELDRCKAEKTPIVCVTDNYYHPLSNNYEHSHHMHFVIVDHDPQGGELMLTDEDWSKQYWNPDNCRNGIQYLDTWTDFDALRNMCIHRWREHFTEVPFLQQAPHGSFAILYHLRAVQAGEVSKEKINQLFLFQLRDMLEHQWDHLNYLNSQFEVFRASFSEFQQAVPELTLEAASAIKKNDSQGMKKRIYYPMQLRCWLAHYQHLSAQYQVLSRWPVAQPKGITEKLEKILSAYTQVEYIIAIAIIKNIPQQLESARDLFYRLFDEELEIYREILHAAG